ncbi:MAG TPA: glycosyltransferase [Patescibacteria group bacterium]|nr:glycosyltransferase [Patescibacteria group bacterium]
MSKKIKLINKSFSIVLETENLGMAGVEDLEKSLNSLKSQKYPIKKAKEVLIIAGGHVSEDVQKRLKKKYPWVTIKKTKEHLDYVGAKAVGSKIAKGDILIFVDSDSVYEKGWLGNMLKVFSDFPDADVVSGNTEPRINSNYAMSLTLAWMFIIRGPIRKTKEVYEVPMNNFAIKRNALLKVPLPKNLPFYRSGSIWKNWLIENGLKIYTTPNVMGYHATPANLRDWWYRMLINGRDFVALGDYTFKGMKLIEKKSVLKRFMNLVAWSGWKTLQVFVNVYKTVNKDKKTIQYLLLGVPFALLDVSIIILGSLITFINRDYLLKIVTAYEAEHVV